MKQSTYLGMAKSSFMRARSAFTLTELLVVISILAALSVVAYVSVSGHIKTANNTTRISTIDSLSLGLSDYYQMKKTLPEPNSNYIAYDEKGTYAHSLSGAYGVSGHVSNNFLPAGYMNFHATDPESQQYYGYGKTLDPITPTFNLAAVLYDDTTGGYKTYVKGTYQGQKLASLIRSYSSSNFVSQDSREELPYNPYERKIDAHISSLSGNLLIQYSGGNTLTLTSALNVPFSFTGELSSGDTIVVATGSTVLLHISDGSELSLGSATNQTELELSSLLYTTDTNLSTKVRLFLKSGEAWTEAPHLRAEADSQSDFSIQTDSAVAAVRGTVFGINKSATGVTDISLQAGKLEINKVDQIGNATPFTSGFSTTATGGFVLSNAKSYMIVPEGSTPIILNGISKIAGTITSTGTLNPVDINKKLLHPPFSFGYRPVAEKISFVANTGTAVPPAPPSGILTILYDNPGADSYELYFGTGIVDPNLVLRKPDLAHPSFTGTLSGTGTITITGAFTYEWESMKIWTYAFRVCLRGICSVPDVQHLAGNTFSYGPFHNWGDTTKKLTTSKIVPAPTGCPTDPSAPDFWSKDCLVGTNSGLVAYATYDQNMNMYAGSGSLLKHTVNGGIPISFSGSSEGTGIILKQNGADYVNYPISGLELDNNFRIEMNVKGSALKRTSSSPGYVLFDFPPLNIGDTNAGFRLSIFSTQGLLLGIHQPINNQVISLNKLQTLNDNTFYRVVASYTSLKSKIEIFDGEKSVLISTDVLDGISSINPGTLNSLYIGSYLNDTQSHIGQWAGIIDSVKIYKN